MRRATLFLFLLVIWLLLVESFTVGQFLLGTLVAAGIIWLFPSLLPSLESIRLTRLPRLAHLLAYFLKELLLANIAVAKVVLNPGAAKPGIVAHSLQARGSAEITWLANLITLTPGTISVEVAPDSSHLFIHAIDATDEEAVLAAPRRFEAMLKEVFR